MKRYEVLEKLIKENKLKNIAEIGVFKGETALYLLENCRDTTHTLDNYFLIDVAFQPGLMSQFDTFICHLIEKESVEASKDVPDNVLDLVFIDGNHSYEQVMADLKVWTPKVKNGGFITGHDFCNPAHRGVEKAVKEFFKDANIEFIEDCYMFIVRKGA